MVDFYSNMLIKLSQYSTMFKVSVCFNDKLLFCSHIGWFLFGINLVLFNFKSSISTNYIDFVSAKSKQDVTLIASPGYCHQLIMSVCQVLVLIFNAISINSYTKDIVIPFYQHLEKYSL